MKEFNYRFFAYLGIALTLGIILVFGLFAALQPMRMHTAAREIEAEAMERGDEVFARDCATCHGGQGEGMGNIGPALNTQEFLNDASDDVIFNTIADGRPGTSMPAWAQARGGPYNAQVTEDLVTLIRAWQSTAPSVEELAYLGDPVEGAVLFSTTCYACHGVSGEGRIGPGLNDPRLLEQNDDDYFREVIANGRRDRGMPTWGSVLSPAQIEDIVAYIRSWEEEAPVPMTSLGGDTNRGEIIFASTCIACHGPGGEGTSIATSLAEAPILADPDAVYSTISEGRLEDGMPSWGQVLSPAEINDLVAYVSTLEAGASPEETPSPDLLQDELAAAQLLYSSHCGICHGMSGEVQDYGPALVANEFVQSNDDEAVLGVIADGRANTAMLASAGKLTEEEMMQITQLLRSWQ